MGYAVKTASTTRPLLFRMVLASDRVSGATGLSPTVTISKAGAAFGSPAGAVTEVANGWYKVAGNATDNNTTGPLLLKATAGTADECADLYEVVAYDPDAVAIGIAADGFDLEQATKLILAAVAGKLSGGGTATEIMRAANDSKARITATVDSSGNRTAITLDAT